MKAWNYVIIILLFTVSYVASQKKLNLDDLRKKLAQACYQSDKYKSRIKDQNVIKCNRTFDIDCWPDTKAGDTVVQYCPVLLFSPKGNISRRCDEHGNWQTANITNCRKLSRNEAVEKAKQSSNIPTDEKDNSRKHTQRVQQVYMAFSWLAFLLLLPTFIIICIVMSRENDRFNLHKNLILAFILRTVTLFIHFYGNLGKEDADQMVCNVFWILNRYFAASEITWMLNEGLFLLRMLLYPLEYESFFWYFFMFGWGFSGLLTFCAYLPYAQFKLSRISNSCWIKYSQSDHMLVLYIPLTIMLLINFGIAMYVVHVLTRKLKTSGSSHFNTVKKGAKGAVVLISLLGIIYLLIFYKPENSTAYSYFVAVIYPFQGVLVCIFCVFVSSEFREALWRHWMKWRYGQMVESNPYSVEDGERSRTQTPGDNEAPEERLPRAPSPTCPSPNALSRTSLQDTSGGCSYGSIGKEGSQFNLLSRSSDLTKFRVAKIEPEPVRPLRVNAASPEEWCPPSLQAVKAWEGNENTLQNCDESTNTSGHTNEGYLPENEGDLTLADSQSSLNAASTEQSTTQGQSTTQLLHELQPLQNLPDKELTSEIGELEESRDCEPDSTTQLLHELQPLQNLPDKELMSEMGELEESRDYEPDSRDVSSDNDYPENQDVVLSTAELEHDNELSTDDFSMETAGLSLPVSAEQSIAEQAETESVGLAVINDVHSDGLDLLKEQSDTVDHELYAEAATASNSHDNPAEGSSKKKSQSNHFWRKVRQLAHQRYQRRKSGQSIDDVPLPEEQKHHEKYKQPDQYRMAWIADILREGKPPNSEDETDA